METRSRRSGRRPDLGRDRRAALRPRLPARLPADRQPPRRRGPHPGGLRPGLPLAVDLHARHLRGLAAPDHHQPLPRPGPPQAADPLRRALRRARRPADQRARRRPDAAYADRTFDDDVERALATPAAGLPRRRRAVRRRGPVLRGDRRDPRTPSSAPCGRGSTAAARCSARRWRTARRPPAGPGTPARAARPRPHRGPRGAAHDRRTSATASAPCSTASWRRRRRSAPGSTCTPATTAATSSSARAGSRPGWPGSSFGDTPARRPAQGRRCSGAAAGLPPGDALPGAEHRAAAAASLGRDRWRRRRCGRAGRAGARRRARGRAGDRPPGPRDQRPAARRGHVHAAPERRPDGQPPRPLRPRLPVFVKIGQ